MTIQHADTGKGIPNVLPQDLSYITVIPAVAIPETSAVAKYERDQGKLTYFTPYGVDPLQDRPDLSAKWDQLFIHKAIHMTPFSLTPFQEVVSNLTMQSLHSNI